MPGSSPADARGCLGAPRRRDATRRDTDSANDSSLKPEGRFTGDDAENTRVLITRFRDGMRFVLDLTDVTFMDSAGEEVLSFFGRFGAEFAASTSYTLARMRAPASPPSQRWGIGYEHVRHFPHKRWPTQGPRTSAGKRGSLKTACQPPCTSSNKHFLYERGHFVTPHHSQLNAAIDFSDESNS